MIKRTSAPILLAFCTLMGLSARAEPPALLRMGIKEITVFKDGHTFVLHAGKMPTDAEGNVSLDYLPTPILGTFWPYSADRNATLVSVTAGPRKVKVEKTALNMRELIEGNPGAKVTLTQADGKSFDAEIVRVPRREVEAPTVSASPTEVRPANNYGFGSANYQPLKESPPKADAVLVRTKEAVIAIPFALIKKVAFRGAYNENVATDEYKNRLLLKLDWAKNKVTKTADVGMVYLQKGVRWIPHYRISIDGKGKAVVRLQATLINELADFKDVTANLVIGTPSFFFKDTPDPISLQQSFPALSRYFQADSQTGHAFSNAIMSQGGFGGGGFGGGGRSSSLIDTKRHSCLVEMQDNLPQGTLDNISADKNEDLYVFAVKHISLKRGETMSLTVSEVSVPYRDVYMLEMPFAPPETVRENVNQVSRDQLAELNRIARRPHAQHRIRLTNTSESPFTTAPALIVNGARVLAQGLTTYTPKKGDLDVTLTTAGDIKTTGGEHIEKQTPNVTAPNGNRFTLYQKVGEFTITNFGDRAIDLEVTRFIPGKVDSVTPKGAAAQVGMAGSDNEDYFDGSSRPYWWGWYYWPWYWDQLNGLSRIAWSVELDPGKSTTLKYTYSYFWE